MERRQSEPTATGKDGKITNDDLLRWAEEQGIEAKLGQLRSLYHDKLED